MVKKASFLLLAILSIQAYGQDTLSDKNFIKKIYSAALSQNQGYKWLKELTDMGPRLTGSEQATNAVIHFKKIADSLGFHTFLQEVTVPHWVRGGKEKAFYEVDGTKHPMNCCALGGSIGTTSDGLKARVVEIDSFEQLQNMTDQLHGKIAFYNIPMDPAIINSFTAYSQSVKERYIGAVEASKKGAVGVVIRSLSSTINEFPHTGSMTYQGADNKIPAMAISTADAELLSQDLQKNPELEFYMKMNCRMLDSTTSYNLVAEIKGNEKPEDIILIGGHIDSWDLGTGAHDDGAGCMQALDAARLLKTLDHLPKRTLRVVFFMNEENGLNGARQYARESVRDSLHHVIAIESDAGGYTPRGISMTGPDSVLQQIQSFKTLLEPYGLHQFTKGGAGADIGRLPHPNLILLDFRPDSQRYFDMHHSAADVLTAVSPRELEMGTATLASLIYLMDRYDVVVAPK